MKKILSLSLLVVILTGCNLSDKQNDTVNQSNANSVNEQLNAVLTYNNTTVNSVAAIKTGATFIPVNEIGQLKFTTKQPISNLSVGMKNEEGIAFTCAVDVIENSSSDYNFRVCFQDGIKFYLIVSGQVNGREFTYNYPLYMTDDNTLQTFSNHFFEVTISEDLFHEQELNETEDDIYLRIQNYDPDQITENYVLQSGEYYIEFFAGKTDINQENFKKLYQNTSESKLNKKSALYGTDRLGGGETVTNGFGYFVSATNGKSIAIHVYTNDDSSEQAAQEVIDAISWEF